MDFGRASLNRMALAGLALEQRPNLIHLPPHGSRQGENTADALVYKHPRCCRKRRSFRLPMPARETFSVITRAEAANTEVIGRVQLVVVVSQQSEEILELIVGARPERPS